MEDGITVLSNDHLQIAIDNASKIVLTNGSNLQHYQKQAYDELTTYLKFLRDAQVRRAIQIVIK